MYVHVLKPSMLPQCAGDALAVDDVVAQIETDKVTLDVRSPYNGMLTEFLVREFRRRRCPPRCRRCACGAWLACGALCWRISAGMDLCTDAA